jgi:hypothetical protein
MNDGRRARRVRSVGHLMEVVAFIEIVHNRKTIVMEGNQFSRESSRRDRVNSFLVASDECQDPIAVE